MSENELAILQRKEQNKQLKAFISMKGARANNLKNIDLEIPKNKLVVVTGVSGSGKSSITMDTLYAEGQRRYVESLSSYARQFLMRMKKPDVDYIKGICQDNINCIGRQLNGFFRSFAHDGGISSQQIIAAHPRFAR